MRAIQKIGASKYVWLLLLIVLFVINFLAASFHSRIDLTKEKRYTLSGATKDLLNSLDDDVQINVFLKGDFPSGFRKLANSTDALMEYQFVKTLDKLVNERKPVIGYSIGNGEPTDERSYEIPKVLAQDYQFGLINLKTQPIIPNLDVLMLVKPTESFTEEEK